VGPFGPDAPQVVNVNTQVFIGIAALQTVSHAFHSPPEALTPHTFVELHPGFAVHCVEPVEGATVLPGQAEHSAAPPVEYVPQGHSDGHAVVAPAGP
jgi:hypothetical protein